MSHWTHINRTAFLLEAPGEKLSPRLFQLLEAAPFLGLWALPPPLKPEMLHLSLHSFFLNPQTCPESDAARRTVNPRQRILVNAAMHKSVVPRRSLISIQRTSAVSTSPKGQS